MHTVREQKVQNIPNPLETPSSPSLSSLPLSPPCKKPILQTKPKTDPTPQNQPQFRDLKYPLFLKIVRRVLVED